MLSDLIEVINLCKLCGVSNEVFTMFLNKTIKFNKTNDIRLSDEENIELLKNAILFLGNLNSKKNDISTTKVSIEKSSEIETKTDEIVKLLQELHNKTGISFDDLFKMTKIHFYAKNLTEDEIDEIVTNTFIDYVVEKRNIK